MAFKKARLISRFVSKGSFKLNKISKKFFTLNRILKREKPLKRHKKQNPLKSPLIKQIFFKSFSFIDRSARGVIPPKG